MKSSLNYMSSFFYALLLAPGAQRIKECWRFLFFSCLCRELAVRFLACESFRFSFALRRWGRFAKEKRMLSQAIRFV